MPNVNAWLFIILPLSIVSIIPGYSQNDLKSKDKNDQITELIILRTKESENHLFYYFSFSDFIS
jgi:hypothetical protein